MPIERKLAAIMFTDIAGYTAQMSKDEAVAISLLNKKESVLKPLITKHNGTYVKSTGDGSLSYFNSAVDAATCAKRFQESIYDDKDLNVRVGVHLGDTIFEKGDIRGDGVNIASRLESMAVEGGVFVSKEVHDQLANQKEFEGVSLGLQSMKGVGRLVEVYGLKGDKLNEPNPTEYQENKINKHSDDEVPSIAIIPFRNKGKKEDAFYAYGICADLITDCTSAGLIRVTSLEDIEKNENWDKLKADELSSKLFVRYIAQGTLWKMDDVFQLSVELYDFKDKKIVWSDRWEEDWDNLTTIKINLSDGLLKALETKSKVERQVETTNTEAYEYYLKAKYKFKIRENKEDIAIARGLAKKAIELDDKMIVAKRLLGMIYKQVGELSEAMEIYNKTLMQSELVDNKQEIACLHLEIGATYGIKGDSNNSQNHFNRALKIFEKIENKSGIGYSLGNLGLIWEGKGDYEKALEYNTRAQQILDELGDKLAIAVGLGNAGMIAFKKGNINKALDYSKSHLEICEIIGDNSGIAHVLNNIGMIYLYKTDYVKALKNLNNSLIIAKKIGFSSKDLLETASHLFLSKKILLKEYNVAEIHTLIKEQDEIDDYINYALFKLLEDTSYLETAYNQIQEKANNLEPDVAAKLLGCPIPKAIVEEWEKVK